MTSDARIGQTLHDVLEPSYMIDTVAASISAATGEESVPGLDSLAAIAQREFGRMTITAMSYSPKRRRYQVAVRIDGERAVGATYHLRQSAFKAVPGA